MKEDGNFLVLDCCILDQWIIYSVNSITMLSSQCSVDTCTSTAAKTHADSPRFSASIVTGFLLLRSLVLCILPSPLEVQRDPVLVGAMQTEGGIESYRPPPDN